MMLVGGISELGLIGSVPESSDEESDPLQIGSCWWEWGSGRDIDAVEEMLFARDEKNPPSLRAMGGVGVFATGADAGEDDNAGEDVGVLEVEGVFHNLNPHRDVEGAFPEFAVAGGADCDIRPVGGCMPMLFSEMKVRRARTQVSDASWASRVSVSSCRVSSSCSFITWSSFLSSSTSVASCVGGRSGVGLVLPKNPESRLEAPEAADVGPALSCS